MRSFKRIITVIMLILVLAFGVLFSIQNDTAAPLDLLVFQLAEQPVSLWILVAFAVGGLCGMLISMLAIVRLKSQSIALQRKLDKASKDLSRLSTAEPATLVKSK